MAEVRNRNVLVTGAVGHQGRAVASTLQAKGHHVRVMTHDPDKEKHMKELKCEVIQGDSRKRADLDKAVDGMDGVFFTTQTGDGPEAEVAHGKAVIDACAGKDVAHVVYSSVSGANDGTGVPYFESKGKVEEHLRQAGISYTILRPVWLMEHFASPWYRPSIEKGVLSTPLRPEKDLQMVSAADVGRIVAEVFENAIKFVGREIDIAGDHLTMQGIVEEISRVLSRTVRYDRIPESRVEKAVGSNWAPMFRWLDQHGYDVDIWLSQSKFRRYEISLTSFRDYLEDSHLGIGAAA